MIDIRSHRSNHIVKRSLLISPISHVANLTDNHLMDITTIRRANLDTLIKEAGGKSKLARLMGKKQNYLSQVHRPDGPNDKERPIGTPTARRLELAMKRPRGWMDLDHSSAIEGNTTATDLAPRRVRVISWAQAGRLGESMLEDFTDEATIVYADASIGQSAFALKVRGDGMVDPSGKSYPDGCLIVVDPARESKPGDRVIVRLATAEEAVFKQLEFDGAQYFLKPLNPRYPIMAMPADAKIIGVVVLTQISE